MIPKSNKFLFALLFLPLGILVFYFTKGRENKPLKQLAYYGPKTYEGKSDTVYHTLPSFSFINQDGEVFTDKNITGKIIVAEYFFTTCKSICPIMNNNLEKVADAFKGTKDVMILSHTVDPETDSVPTLAMYSHLHHADNRLWVFLTGKKEELYGLARKGYLLNAEEGDGGEEDFIHTQNFALLDKEKHIRGFYDGTDSLEIVRLIKEIEILRREK